MMNLPNSYVAIDIETTGLEPKSDKIIEIAGVLVENGTITAEKSTLVNPRQKLNEYVRELTGIQDAMLREAPRRLFFYFTIITRNCQSALSGKRVSSY